MNKSKYFWMVLLAILAACTSAQPIAMAQTSIPLTQTALPTVTLLPPTFTPTATHVVILPTPYPTQPPFVPFITPDAIQVERWKEYQTELAKALFSFPPPEGRYDPEEYKKAICEWDILARSGQEVFVWAVCASTDGLWRPMNPAVIYLEPDGSIRKVNVSRMEYPRQSPSQLPIYDLDLFPKEVREKLCLYYIYFVAQCDRRNAQFGRENALEAHLRYREGYAEEPPLIILLAMPTATPAP